ncbi:MAG: hypothetical protein LBI55_01405 [Oscillospiraceae bacterium]|jgi:hypothetical protein|nr:hypothetical protein [Oscillospiraceae bacterium]
MSDRFRRDRDLYPHQYQFDSESMGNYVSGGALGGELYNQHSHKCINGKCRRCRRKPRGGMMFNSPYANPADSYRDPYITPSGYDPYAQGSDKPFFEPPVY